MKSKTSFFNKTIYKKNLSRFFFFPVLYFLALFVGTSCKAILDHLELLKYKDVYAQTLQDNSDLHDAIMNSNISLVVAIYMILTTLAVFSYLYQRRSCNMMHAFPVNRKILFGTGVLSILTMALVPQFLIAIINTIICVVFDAGSIAWVSWYWFLCMMGYDLLFLGIGLFTAMISGQIVTNFVFYWIFNFMFLAAEFIIRLLLSFMCFGMHTSNVYENTHLFLTPVVYTQYHTDLFIKENTRCIYHIDPQALILLLVYAVVGLVLGFVAYTLYRRKPLESCGDFIAVSFMKPIFTFCMTFFTSILLMVGVGYALTNLLGRNNTLLLIISVLFCLVISFILYLLFYMLVDHSIHVCNQKHIKTWGICAGILLGFLFLISVDLFGIEKYTPDPSDILQADVSCGEALYSLRDPDEIEQMLDIHKKIIDDKAELEDYARLSDEPYVGMQITYVLKDGTCINRSYNLPDCTDKSNAYDKICNQLEAFFNAPDMICYHGISENYDDLTLQEATIYLSNDTEHNEEKESLYTSEQLDTLYRAFLLDIQSGNYKILTLHANDACYTETLTLDFLSPEMILTDRTRSSCYYNGRYGAYIFSRSSMATMLSQYEDAATKESELLQAYGDLSWYTYVCLTPSCTNTLKAMQDIGMIQSTDDLTLSTAGDVRMYINN